jgi:hypothetical protein
MDIKNRDLVEHEYRQCKYCQSMDDCPAPAYNLQVDPPVMIPPPVCQRKGEIRPGTRTKNLSHGIPGNL